MTLPVDLARQKHCRRSVGVSELTTVGTVGVSELSELSENCRRTVGKTVGTVIPGLRVRADSRHLFVGISEIKANLPFKGHLSVIQWVLRCLDTASAASEAAHVRRMCAAAAASTSLALVLARRPAFRPVAKVCSRLPQREPRHRLHMLRCMLPPPGRPQQPAAVGKGWRKRWRLWCLERATLAPAQMPHLACRVARVESRWP